MEIVEVYHGDRKLKGRKFTVLNGDAPNNGDVVPSPAMAVGERALWPLVESDDALQPDPYVLHTGMPIAQAARTIRYSEATEAVKVMAEVVSLAPEARLERLTKLVYDERPEVSAWAVDVLGFNLVEILHGGDRSGRVERLAKFAESQKLTPAAFIALDQALGALSPLEWERSAAHFSLCDRATAGSMDFYTASRVAARARTFKGDAGFDLVKRILSHPAAAQERQSRAMILQEWPGAPDNGATLTFLLGLIRTSSDTEVKRVAAQRLHGYGDTYADVARIRATEADPSLALDPELRKLIKDAGDFAQLRVQERAAKQQKMPL